MRLYQKHLKNEGEEKYGPTLSSELLSHTEVRKTKQKVTKNTGKGLQVKQEGVSSDASCVGRAQDC